MHAALLSGKPSSIPGYRSEYIDLKLREFIHQNGIKRWPLDCMVILNALADTGKYGIKGYMAVDSLPGNLDAVTHYHSSTRSYYILLNRSRVHYPFQKSRHRRLNFTIAHEIGHILLEHLAVHPSSRTEEVRAEEDMEADEFAARLLMPIGLLCSFNYYSIEGAASWLNVSNTALITRLIRTGRVDLLTSRRVKSCIRCGNVRFSSMGRFCGVCGQRADNGRNGIRRIYYPDEISMDSYKRALVCPGCGRDLKYSAGEKCTFCSTYIFNFCSSYQNVPHTHGSSCSFANPGFARYCQACGQPTVYNSLGFFREWRDIYHAGEYI